MYLIERLRKASTTLVLGGAGFIGSFLVDDLVERGHSVRVLDQLVPEVHARAISPPDRPRHLQPGVELIHGDMGDRKTLDRALEGVDVVFHQAAELGLGRSMYNIAHFAQVNSVGTAVLLEALIARRGSIRKLVVASSMSIYGEGQYTCRLHGTVCPDVRSDQQLHARDWEPRCPLCTGALTPQPTREDKPLNPTSVYAITKRDQEELCLVVGKAYSIPTVALRYFNVYGPRQALCNPYTGVAAIFSSRLLNNSCPIVFEDGNQTRDFVHVSDVVAANILAMESEDANYHAINVGTGHATSIRQVAEILAAGLGKNIEPNLTSQSRSGDIRHCFADISKARALLGYEPRRSLRQGMADLLAWVRAQQPDDRTDSAMAELEEHGLTA